MRPFLINVSFKELLAEGLAITIGKANATLKVNSFLTAAKCVSVPVSIELTEGSVVSGVLSATVTLKNLPKYAQLIGGCQTETGITGSPMLDDLPLPEGLVLSQKAPKKPKGSGQLETVNTNPFLNNEALPLGWESRVDHNGRNFFIDHNSRKTTWRHPLNVGSLSGKDSGPKSSKRTVNRSEQRRRLDAFFYGE